MCSTKIAITASTPGSAATARPRRGSLGRLGGDELDRAGDDRLGGSARAARPASPRQRRDVQPRVGARVGAHDHAGRARWPRSPRRAPRRQRLLGQHGGGVEQVVEPVAADHARAREQRVDRCRRTPRSARPCASCAARAPRRRPPRLDRQHRLRARHPPRHAAELARVAERLQVQRDDLRSPGPAPSTAGGRCSTDRPCRRARRTRDSPIPRRDAPSIAAAPNAPLWDDEADRARRARRRGRTSRVSDTAGSVLTTPMQFGPTSRIPLARQTSSSSASRAAPSAPASANPAVMTTSAATPAAAHSRATPGTGSAGTATIARSTGPGVVRTDGAARRRADEVRVRVDRVQLAAEAVGQRVPERRAAEGVRPPRRADHRDRARPQHPLDRRDGGDAVAVLERAPRVLAQLGRELELDPVRRGVHLRPGSRTRGRR